MKGLRTVWWGLCVVLIMCISVSTGFSATVPSVLNYQGTLNDSGGNPVTGQHEMTFRLYNELLGGTAFWSETQTVSLDATGHFSVTLGSTTPVDKDNFNGQTYIGIQVGTDPELAPRQQLTSVAYALKAADAIPAGGIIMWSGAIDAVPAGWALCDGNNGTPDLRDRFVLGAGNSFAQGATGGEQTHVLTVAEMPSHTHTGPNHRHSVDPPNTNTSTNGSHSHQMPANDFSVDGSDKNDHVSGGRNKNVNIYPRTSYDGNHYHSVNIPAFWSAYSGTGNTGSQGSGAAHNNMPPYYALAFILKL